ncbi:hypothetical protein DM813_28115 [Pseudomonas alkylphenolica]|uniref:Uncharacterized protein n=1 Tax=Pseudomonas alkylphenolica TaxID=237609 RepID=A0A443ZEU7_9PSED|nr:fimbrial protein [Pseudomonas alkylphenolica]RWU17227.1 hypothetical protein DM813_28115 [Pseudomonas alkylphenolica]
MRKPIIGLMIFSAALLTLPDSAWASCSFRSGGTETYNIEFGTVTVPPNASAGTVLARKSLNNKSGDMTCTNSGSLTATTTLFTTPNPIRRNAYDTNIPGVAITFGTFYDAYGSINAGDRVPFTGGASISTNLVTAILYKSSEGATGAGELSIGKLGAIEANDGGTPLESVIISLTGDNTIVPAASCSVSKSAIGIPLGDVDRSQFRGIGHETNPVPFTIDLDCDGSTGVSFTIDATPDSSGARGVMAISPAPDGSASGVGIKLSHNNMPVEFGAVIPAGTSDVGAFSIPFAATYYQTSNNVEAGQANGTASFTLTYE